MKPIHGKVAGFLLCVSLACAVPQLLAKKKETFPAPGPAEQKRAVHALNRLTFGPRPGDVQRVTTMGVDAWIEQQLHPGKINNAALEARLAPFRTLRMSPREVAEDFPDGGLVKQVIDGKKAMPSDPAKRAVFQVQIARQEEKREEKQEVKRERKTDAGKYREHRRERACRRKRRHKDARHRQFDRARHEQVRREHDGREHD